MKLLTYSELIRIPDFMERVKYLRIGGRIGESTFGSHRYLNQILYKTKEWRSIRDDVILRDLGHDLAMRDDQYEVSGIIVVHHINPITLEDIQNHRPEVFDPEFLVCCSDNTHKAIHYGYELKNLWTYEERKPGDTQLWGTRKEV